MMGQVPQQQIPAIFLIYSVIRDEHGSAWVDMTPLSGQKKVLQSTPQKKLLPKQLIHSNQYWGSVPSTFQIQIMYGTLWNYNLR